MSNSNKQTVLISAYAVNPYKGSEDGTGWNISREISKDYNTIVITRKNNIPAIEKYVAESGDPVLANMQFVGYDLPNWFMWLKKRLGERGYVFYFYLWQFFLPRFIKKNKFEFDIAHALNFHSDSIPTFLWKLGKPTFWGPIGHHPVVPTGFVKDFYGAQNFIKDRAYNAFKWALRNLDPLFWLTQKRVTHVFGINSSIQSVLPHFKSDFQIIPAVATQQPSVTQAAENDGKFRLISVGRFHYMKGFDIVIESFAAFYNTLKKDTQSKTVLTLVGKGEEQDRLKKLALDLNIDHAIEWVSWVDKAEMEALYLQSSVFVFGSHEGAGMVIPEAMSYGLPIVCFDNVGPGELAGNAAIKIQSQNRADAVKAFSDAISELFHFPETRAAFSLLAKERYETFFTWNAKGDMIKAAYAKQLSDQVVVFHPSSELYGADRILVNAINAMPTTTQKIVYLKFEGPLKDYILKNTVNCEVKTVPFMPVIYRKIFTPKGIIQFAWDYARFFRFLKREVGGKQVKSAYVNTFSASFILPMLSFLKVPSFIHVHEIIDSPKMIGKLTAMLSGIFAKRIVCVSVAVKKSLLNYYPKASSKTSVLHNGISEVAVTEKEREGKINFYLFGRIMPKKGQWFLTEALAHIPAEKRAKATFTMMGGAVPGAEYMLDELKLSISEKGLESCIEIKPFAANISAAMQQADVCLVPSLMKDPFPTTVLEAMSASKPVIATNHGGAKEAILGSNAGLLIAPNETQQLAQQIEFFIDNPSQIQEMGAAARMRYMNNYTLDHFNTKWSSFMTENGFV